MRRQPNRREPVVNFTRYKTKILPDHPIANGSGHVRIHRMILYDKIGNGDHACHWCGRTVQWSTAGSKGNHDPTYLCVDHVDGNSYNNAETNLVPSCMACNTVRGVQFRHRENPASYIPKMRGNRKFQYKKIRVPPDHPLLSDYQRTSRYPTLPAHRFILYKKIGPGPHPCHWCGKPINWKLAARGHGIGRFAGAIVADHLNNDGADNNPDNLVPSCSNCNIHRTGNERFRKTPNVIINGTRVAAVERTCRICGRLFLIPPAILKFHHNGGRYCSMLCRDKGRWADAREQRKCLYCGVEFTCFKLAKKLFCGYHCSNSARGSRWAIQNGLFA